MADNLSHLFLQNTAEALLYTSKSGGGSDTRIPARDRNAHGNRLLQELETVRVQLDEIRAARAAAMLSVREGIYLEFQSAANFDLLTKSLERIKSGIRLLNVRVVVGENGADTTYATVFVPRGREAFFIRKIRAYLENENRFGTPSNNDLVNSIEHIRLAVLDSFWTDDRRFIPDNRRWCEAWLLISNPAHREGLISDFNRVCELYDIALRGGESLLFPERLVVLINANRQQLMEIVESVDYLSELRLARETASFWVSQSNIDQTAWVNDLLGRINILPSDVTVSILDTGVNNGHLLLQPILSNHKCLSIDSSWGTSDHGGHGTLMAGLSGYGDLQKALEVTTPIDLTHDLSSIKVLPPRGANDPELYGYLTQQAISIAEIAAPDRKHIFCSAVTSAQKETKGRPSSWSAAIDQITSGQIDDQRRLFVNCAGNVWDYQVWLGYPNTNLLESINDPAQSWNALTVGAYTEKVTINDPSYIGHFPVAPLRCLSPYSTTSVMWERKWPIKPEVVFEGGNIRRAPDGSLYEQFDDFSLLSTSSNVSNNQFETISATSAAAAQAAWMAAKVQYAYPNAWPETIKGLIIHSAQWPDELIQQFNVNTNSKTDVQQLMRVCGYGVPDLSRAIYSSNSSLTLVAQESIQPFRRNESGTPATNDMHFYNLPWPAEVLLGLGGLTVKMRITVCYFIEPGPGEVGWKDKYRYASHGFRFDLKTPGESRQDFIRRINVAAREDNERVESNSGSDRWKIGPKTRVFGSVHSDIWEGTAADIATSNMIAIYPVIGWWRERTHLGNIEKQTRYSLIVTLETPAQDVDIYTPVANMIVTPITIRT